MLSDRQTESNMTPCKITCSRYRRYKSVGRNVKVRMRYFRRLFGKTNDKEFSLGQGEDWRPVSELWNRNSVVATVPRCG
jgi:hypothetical protein